MVLGLIPALLLSSSSGKYYIATMTMITASTSLTIFIMNIHFCGAEAKPVPHWAKVLIIDYMSKIFFVYEVGESCATPESESVPLSPEETASDDLDVSSRDLHFHQRDPHKYSNGHGVHHHNKFQANGNANRDNGTSRLERIDRRPEHTHSYRHIRRDDRNFQAPPPPQNLPHLNGGVNYPAEKLAVQACPGCCLCTQHKQVQQPSSSSSPDVSVGAFVDLLVSPSGGEEHPVHCKLLPRAESYLCQGRRVEEGC